MYKYKTIGERRVHEIPAIMGSRFIAYAYPVESQWEAKSIIDEIHKQHPSATHVCFAYRTQVGAKTDLFGIITVESAIQYSYDAWEPPYTAWKPIERVLQSHGLDNTLLAVVRYFWGKKLGIGWLIKAYTQAAQEITSLAPIVEKQLVTTTSCSFLLSELGIFLHLLQNNGRQHTYNIVSDNVEAKIVSALSEKDNVKTILCKHMVFISWA